MKLQEYPRLLQPLINCADPPVLTILPFLIALSNAGVVDGTPGCGASPWCKDVHLVGLYDLILICYGPLEGRGR